MFKLTKLSNGLTVVTESVEAVRSVAVGIWIKSGSRHEDAGEQGISHFIEHMLFKGTANRTAFQIADDMDAVGGQLNAYTTKETTCYYTRVLSEHFPLALDVLADMYFNSSFEASEIEKERSVICEEISMYEDSPEDLVADIIQPEIWENDALGRPILGTKDTISEFTQATFKGYLGAHYRPENTVVSVCGNIDGEDALARVSAYFGGFRREDGDEARDFANKYKRSAVKREKDIEQLHLCLTFPGLPLGSPQNYDLMTLNTLFGGGMSSRLFQNVREKHGLVYSVYSYVSSYTNNGVFSVYAALSPPKLNEAVKLITNELERVKSEAVSEETLRRTKEQHKTNYILGLESMSSRMSLLGRSQTLLGRIYTDDEVMAKIEAVSADSVKALANEIFAENSMSVSLVGKVKKIDVEKLTACF